MNTVILSCESLEVYVAAAQKTAGTTYPVIWLKQKYHEEPAVMRSHILETIASLPRKWILFWLPWASAAGLGMR